MEQAPKTTEAPQAKGKKTWAVVAAVVIIIIVVVAGLYFAGYLGTTTTTGTPVSIFETPVGSCSNVQPPNCGYNPDSLPISTGTTVVWTNDGSQPHSVTACYSASSTTACPTPSSDPNPAFDSGATNFLDGGEKFSFKFDNAGTFNYYCRVHEWMHGTVTIS